MKLIKWLEKWLKEISQYQGPAQLIDFKKPSGNEGILEMGRYASEMIKNPSLENSFKIIEDKLFTAWKTSSPKDEKAREHIYYQLQAVAQVKLILQGMVTNMLIEERLLKEKKRESVND